MPGGDRTGPMGLGPMTGRGAGYCAGLPTPGFMNPVPGRGFGRSGRGSWGRGGGRGWRRQFYATGLPGWARAGRGHAPYSPYWETPPPALTREQEMEMLREQVAQFNETLDEIKQRLDELGKEK
jgi:hypothetical protein